MHKILFAFSLSVLSLQATDYAPLLFHGNCTTCHFETKAVSAPSMVELRAQYRTAFADKKDFVAYMSAWVKKPNEETSLMRDAIEQYSLMPELAFDLETLQSISGYIYDTDFSQEHEHH